MFRQLEWFTRSAIKTMGQLSQSLVRKGSESCNVHWNCFKVGLTVLFFSKKSPVNAFVFSLWGSITLVSTHLYLFPIETFICWRDENKFFLTFCSRCKLFQWKNECFCVDTVQIELMSMNMGKEGGRIRKLYSLTDQMLCVCKGMHKCFDVCFALWRIKVAG